MVHMLKDPNYVVSRKPSNMKVKDRPFSEFNIDKIFLYFYGVCRICRTWVLVVNQCLQVCNVLPPGSHQKLHPHVT